MSRFSKCLSVVLGNEGGFSDHKDDRGGATNYGVIQSTYDAYRKSLYLAPRPVIEIEHDEVESIYYNFWKAAHCDYMPEPLDLQMFDAAINHGPGRAIKLLQEVLGVEIDGICGRETMKALHEEILATSITDICKKYLDARSWFYDRIITTDPSQSVFARGWMNRIDTMQEYV